MRAAIDYALVVQQHLERLGARIVLAESCTAGRIAATLGELPGVSRQLCGCFVVYRNASKSDWLGIAPRLLEDPDIGPVSPQVTEALAHAALARTAEAEFGFAITGDIGPGAPAQTDGTAFCCLVSRKESDLVIASSALELAYPAPRDAADLHARRGRLDEATQRALAFLATHLEATDHV